MRKYTCKLVNARVEFFFMYPRSRSPVVARFDATDGKSVRNDIRAESVAKKLPLRFFTGKMKISVASNDSSRVVEYIPPEPIKFYTKNYNPETRSNIQPEDVIRSGLPWFANASVKWVRDEKFGSFAVRNNPHVCQDYENIEFGLLLEPTIPFVRELDLVNGAAKEYQRRKFEFKTTLFWPERKQLLAEIEFLCEYGFPNAIVVVSNAFLISHYVILADLFPTIIFHLFNVNDLSLSHASIVASSLPFSNLVATDYVGKNVLFVGSTKFTFNSNLFALFEEHMTLQMNWVNIIKPKKSLLSFRLPWNAGETNYLRGAVMFPIWGHRTNTETYLVCDADTEATYQHTLYEQQLFYFNTVSRTQVYDHAIYGGEGIDHCYDCTAEIYVLTKYVSLMSKLEQCETFQGSFRNVNQNEFSWFGALGLEQYEVLLSEEKIAARVKELSKQVSRYLGGSRSLAHPQPQLE